MAVNRQSDALARAQAAFAAGDDARAASLCKHILRQAPTSGPALTLLADVAFRQGDYERAANLARRGRASGYVTAGHVLGCALSKLGQLDQAVAILREVHALYPDEARIEYNLGMVELAAGLWTDGFRHFEARWRVRQPPPYVRPWSAQWRGEPLEGQRIFVFAEQGYGDTIQFARFIPALVESGARVSLAIQPALARLFSDLAGIDLLKAGDAVPAFDYHCPIMSLAQAFGTQLSDIPPPLPLRAIQRFARSGRRRIGLCWAGNRRDPEDRDRSLPIAALGDLIGLLSDYDLFSLQVDGDDDLARCQGGANVLSFGAGVQDFADTATLIATLDLVVTVDTAVAHLAGSLSVPTGLLLWAGCDWRWLRAGDRTPWYPSVGLLRQERRGDWSGPLRRAASLAQKIRTTHA